MSCFTRGKVKSYKKFKINIKFTPDTDEYFEGFIRFVLSFGFTFAFGLKVKI